MHQPNPGRVYGKWNGLRAFVQGGILFSVIGNDNGWVREKAGASELQPFTTADLNEPKNNPHLQRIGGEYQGKCTVKKS